MKAILVVGATGAQGRAIVRYLSSTNHYHILALTRNAASSQAEALAALANVSLVISNSKNGYDVDAFSSAASRSDAVLVNTDGFEIGEKAETFWGIRLFELAARAGVKQFLYSGLDSHGKKSGYDPKLYVGHYEGKARVQEWIHNQKDSEMAWTIIRSGPYIDLLSSTMAPETGDDGSSVFKLPLGSGSIPFIYLDDFAKYVHWALSNPDQSKYLDFGIATAHVSGDEIASAYSASTGKVTSYVDIPIEQWNKLWQFLPNGADTKIGYRSTSDQDTLGMTYGENFGNWWNLYKASGRNQGLIQRDYQFLDRIMPDRVKSIGEWMSKTGYTGKRIEVLKTHAPRPSAA